MSECFGHCRFGGETIFVFDIGADFVTKIFDYFSDLLYQKIIALLGDFFGVMNARATTFSDFRG